jgi:hypothetical protein
MTDRDELVEKVARAICSSDAKQHNTLETVWKIYKLDAEAAIDIVLEEAARVAQDIPCGCAAAIRAMKG